MGATQAITKSPIDTRDRFLDLLRGGSIVAVVLGHWLVTDLHWGDAGIALRSSLGAAPGLWPLPGCCR